MTKSRLGPPLGRREESHLLHTVAQHTVPVNCETGVVGTNGQPTLELLLPKEGNALIKLAKTEGLTLKVIVQRAGNLSIAGQKDGQTWQLYMGTWVQNDETMRPFERPKPGGGRWYSPHDKQLLGLA